MLGIDTDFILSFTNIFQSLVHIIYVWCKTAMLEALQAEEYREERAHVQLVDADEEEPVLIPQDQQEDMTDPGFLSSEHFPPKKHSRLSSVFQNSMI